MNFLRIYNFISLIIICSFVIGFIFFENSSGGGQIDLVHIYKNYQLFEKNNFYYNFPWIDYESTSLPIYYILTSFFFNFQVDTDLRIFNFILAIFTIIFFYKLLDINFREKNIGFKNYQFYLISTILLLSPYLRTSTFWGLEEVIGIFFLIITLYLNEIYNHKKKIFFLILCIFFSCMCFLARQSYAFLLLFIFLNNFEITKIFSKKNLFICSSFFIFLIPAAFFFYEWKHFFPPNSVLITDRFKILKIENISFILNMILIYTVPFVLCVQNSHLRIKDCLIKYKYFFIISFCVISYTIIPVVMPSNGGGAVLKLIKIFFQNEYFIKFFFTLTSLFSLIVIIFLCNVEKKLKFFFPCIIIVFLNISEVFQEYFDPIVLIFMILYFPYKLMIRRLLDIFPLLLSSYFSIFLLSAILYYHYIL